MVEVPDDCLRQLARGKPIDFKGRAVRSDGRIRTLDCRVAPADSDSGKIKIRLVVSRYLILVFDSTYRLLLSKPMN